MFSSNYFQLAKLYLNSNNKLVGIIYSELFINIERTTKRTQEMSELLYKTYKSLITLQENESKISFCAIFGKNFALYIIGQTEFNLKTLSEIRSSFIKI